MVLSMMLSVLTITTEYSFAIIKVNEIQAIELVNKDDGGILSITLKGNKSEQIIYAEDNKDKWDYVKKWMESNVLNIQEEMSKQDVLRHKDTHPGF